MANSKTLSSNTSPQHCDLSSLVQWNSTFALLVDKTSTMSNRKLLADLHGLLIFSVACIVAVHGFCDLSPITMLVAIGTTPSASDLDTLEEILSTGMFFSDLCEEDRLMYEKSSLSILMYLKDTFSCRADWGFRMSSIIWTWAIREFPLDYTAKLLHVTDSRITMSQEALAVTALSAVEIGDKDALNLSLADERLDLAHMYKADVHSNGGTLLHIECERLHLQDISILETLLEAGCDPSLQDERGRLCLHRIRLDDASDAILGLERLREHGVDIS